MDRYIINMTWQVSWEGLDENDGGLYEDTLGRLLQPSNGYLFLSTYETYMTATIKYINFRLQLTFNIKPYSCKNRTNYWPVTSKTVRHFGLM